MFFRKKNNEQRVRQLQDKGKPVADFFGGVHPAENKSPANLYDIQSLPLFDSYRVALSQHIGKEGEIKVQIGQRVLKGEPLTYGLLDQVPVHAPTSGYVEALVKQPNASYFGEEVLAIQIKSDHLDEPFVASPFDYLSAKPDEIISEIHLNGIVGLGGAGFPTAMKVDHLNDEVKIDTIILNAAECEPYISADDRLMREHAPALIQGLDILRKILHPKRILIGIEDNKPEAISALQFALDNSQIDLIRLATKIIIVPTKYPSGGAKQLITLLTGKEIPSGQHASALGMLMVNVGTVFAIKKAVVDREPLIERVVTFAGQQYAHPGNYWVRMGTPIETLIHHFNLSPQTLEHIPLLMGGPMMGFAISTDSSVIKTTNCLLARTVFEVGIKPDEQPCIRCGECTVVCPAKLLPQQLYWYSQGKEHEKAKEHNLFDCIECGACEFVCPSHIPLVHYYKMAKQEIKTADQEAKMAAQAKERYEAKLQRIEAEKQAREARHKNINTNIDEKDRSAVAAAIARVKAKKAEQNLSSEEGAEMSQPSEPNKSRQDMIAAALARAKEKKEAASVGRLNSPNETPQTALSKAEDKALLDPRKAAIAAALERAKAKKMGQVQETSSIQAPDINSEKNLEEIKVSAIDAARERAQNRMRNREQLSNTNTQALETQSESSLPTKEDSRKIAIERARQRALEKREQALIQDKVASKERSISNQKDR